MTDTPDLCASLLAHAAGLGLAELETLHPQMARRTLQRRIEARGMGRARRYVALTDTSLLFLGKRQLFVQVPTRYSQSSRCL